MELVINDLELDLDFKKKCLGPEDLKLKHIQKHSSHQNMCLLKWHLMRNKDKMLS